jgi:hypothetical protein
MKFKERIDAILENNFEQKEDDQIEEGVLLSVNTVISNAIKVPEGDYIVAVVASDTCKLVPTSEAGGQTFEVLRPTLAGFFNPEVHSRTVNNSPTDVLSEEK